MLKKLSEFLGKLIVFFILIRGEQNVKRIVAKVYVTDTLAKYYDFI